MFKKIKLYLKLYFKTRKNKRELHTITSRKIRRLILQFFQNNKINRFVLGITDIKTKINKKRITIIITLERPGLLIGKGGETIDSLQNYLNRILNRDVKFLIKESKLWE